MGVVYAQAEGGRACARRYGRGDVPLPIGRKTVEPRAGYSPKKNSLPEGRKRKLSFLCSGSPMWITELSLRLRYPAGTYRPSKK